MEERKRGQPKTGARRGRPPGPRGITGDEYIVSTFTKRFEDWIGFATAVTAKDVRLSSFKVGLRVARLAFSHFAAEYARERPSAQKAAKYWKAVLAGEDKPWAKLPAEERVKSWKAVGAGKEKPPLHPPPGKNIITEREYLLTIAKRELNAIPRKSRNKAGNTEWSRERVKKVIKQIFDNLGDRPRIRRAARLVNMTEEGLKQFWKMAKSRFKLSTDIGKDDKGEFLMWD